MPKVITDDLDALLDVLPPHIAQPLREREDKHELLEIVMDLGRPPSARFPGRDVELTDREIREEDIEYVVSRVGEFTGDNRAGIERTLHRISAIRNRNGKIIGLSLRVGRAVFGTIELIRDLVESGKNILLLGKPGVGKTTMLREVARVLANELGKRVMIVDTSNEIAGDGDIPHPAIGKARRMQVPTPALQHAVMIEAVENHMPEVIIIDEIGTELEAQASRTIAERGVQLIATAHGNTLENLIMNPTLSDLIGGIQAVTLSDEEARRRGTQKTILERKAPPTFDVLVEIENWERVVVHPDVGATVDAMLRNKPFPVEVRYFEGDEVKREKKILSPSHLQILKEGKRGETQETLEEKKIYLFGVNRNKVEKAAGDMKLPLKIVKSLREADVLLTLKSHYRKMSEAIKDAEAMGIPVYVIRSNTQTQVEKALAHIYKVKGEDEVSKALREAEEAVLRVEREGGYIELSPQNSFIRKLQHELVQRYSLSSKSVGEEPRRRVVVYKGED